MSSCTDKLAKLIELCSAGVHLDANAHKNVYESVDEYLDGLAENGDICKEDGGKVYEGMVERDTIIELQFYPTTPVGFYVIYHYDLEAALDIALSASEFQRQGEADE